MRPYAELERALLADVGKTDSILTSDMSVSDAKRLWLKNSFFKKLEDLSSSKADTGCLALFKRSNESCRVFALEPTGLFEEELINEVKNLFDSYFHQGPALLLDLQTISEGFGVGPGANLDCENYNFYTKLFDSRLSCTSHQLYRDYRCAIASHPTWSLAEMTRSLMFGQKLVGGNRLSFVPKTSEISRSICTEPTLNMVFQKGIGAFLERTLIKRFRIDLSKQPILNRKLARLGSVDGSFGTIDLSSASDSMSLNLMRQLIPKSAMTWFEKARSPSVIYPDGSSDELHMISSMGNAFTFPLQTLLFASIVVACYKLSGVKIRIGSDGPQNFGVFGDDIIVRKDLYAFVCRALKLFGFTVNDTKSFNTGNFRESCGGDFYNGHNIRGIYIKSLKTDADVYSAINRLVRWSSESGIWLFRTVEMLRSWVKFLPIPPHRGDAEGIKVPDSPASLPRCPKTGGTIYWYLSSRAASFRLPTDPAEQRRYPGRRSLISYNQSGLLLAFLGGYIRNGRVTYRKEGFRPKIRRSTTSSWRWSASVEKNSLDASWVRCVGALLPK